MPKPASVLSPLPVNATNVGAAIAGATAKTTPIAADSLGLIDSAASDALKEVTLENIGKGIEIEEVVYIPLTAAGTDASAGLEVFEFRVEEPFDLDAVSFQCDTDNPPTGSAAQIDVNDGGTSIFSTKPTIDAGEFSSATAASPPALTTTPTAFEVGDIITIDLDQVGASNAGREYKAVFHTTRKLKA